jgi:hypothetical protein
MKKKLYKLEFGGFNVCEVVKAYKEKGDYEGYLLIKKGDYEG